MTGLCVGALVMWCVFQFGVVSACPEQAPCRCRIGTEAEGILGKYVLDCQNLGLTRIPTFEPQEKPFHRILLGNNRIASLGICPFFGLQTEGIDLGFNEIGNISALAFCGLEGTLRYLNLQNNRFISPPFPWLKTLTNLTTLILAGNDSPGLDDMSPDTFHGLRKMEHLDLGSCNLRIVLHPGIFKDSTALTELRLNGNGFNIIPSACLRPLTKLKFLDLANNAISEIHANVFKTMRVLKELDLSGNAIDFFHKDAFAGTGATLEKLLVHTCSLEEVPAKIFHHLGNLVHLDLGRNRIKRLLPGSFRLLSKLRGLDISDNPLIFEEDMFRGGLDDHLETLFMRGLRLGEVPLTPLRTLNKLISLDMAANQLSHLPRRFLSGLSATSFSFMWQNISQIDDGAFDGLDYPLQVEFERNQIRDFRFIKDPCMLRYLYVKKNPIRCDCHLYNLIRHKIGLYQGTCESPRKYRGLEIGSTFLVSAARDCRREGEEPVCGWMNDAGKISMSISMVTFMNFFIFYII